MSSRLPGLLVAAVTLVGASTAVAQLVDSGPAGEYFHDTSTGLYWYDPSQHVGQTRAAIDAFVQSSPIWNWATSSQIDALNGKSAPMGQTLTNVMGPPQFTLTNGGPRWIGYHASATNPDGWLAQSFNSPGFTTIDATGFQNNVISWGPGAWLVSTIAPPPPTTAAAVVVGSGCGGTPQLPLLQGSPPQLGQVFNLTLTGAAPMTGGILVASPGAPTPTPLGSGCGLYIDPFGFDEVGPFTTDLSGAWGLAVGIPNAPSLSGVILTLQAAVLPSAGPLGLDLSNGLQLTFGT